MIEFLEILYMIISDFSKQMNDSNMITVVIQSYLVVFVFYPIQSSTLRSKLLYIRCLT